MDSRAKIIDICKLMMTELSTKEIAEGSLFDDISKIVKELTLALDTINDDKISNDSQRSLINLQTSIQTIYDKQRILCISAPTLRRQLNDCLIALETLTQTPLTKSRLSRSFFELELEKMMPSEQPQTPDSPTPIAACLGRLSKHN